MSLESIRKISNFDYKPAINSVVLFIADSSIEVIKILAAAFFLNILSKHAFKIAYQKAPKEMILEVIVIPLLEEILFRGIILRTIHLTQKIWNCLKGHKLNTIDYKIQQVTRIRLSALIFALAHLTNSHKTILGASIQVTWTYFGGICYGNLSEKYKTLSFGILAHGINNGLVSAGKCYPLRLSPIFISALIINKLIAYKLGQPSKPAKEEEIIIQYPVQPQFLVNTELYSYV